ncbi:MAG TPA: response regulator transcription factor [Clostridiales bacterium]|nr:response regulator transcription factor [Clostridiales bacterium]
MKGVILIVEDEAKIARFLELELKHEGYEVEVAYDGRTGYEKAVGVNIDLIILDLMLPELSGIEVCRRVRRVSDVPIIMLTAKDDISDKVMGLDMGADDYVTKPFAIEELLARIRAALKRTANTERKNSDIIAAGKLELSRNEYKVKYADEEIMLSKKEFELLLYLMENKGIVLTREKILENVWGYDFMGDTNITDVYIRYLRSKIDQRFGVQYIHTIRGVGYTFRYE